MRESRTSPRRRWLTERQENSSTNIIPIPFYPFLPPAVWQLVAALLLIKLAYWSTGCPFQHPYSYYPLSPALNRIAEKCAKIQKPFADELIINDTMFPFRPTRVHCSLICPALMLSIMNLTNRRRDPWRRRQRRRRERDLRRDELKLCSTILNPKRFLSDSRRARLSCRTALAEAPGLVRPCRLVD